MLVKAVTLFLVFMAVLAMFGRLRMPKRLEKAKKTLLARKCPDCGAITAKGASCPCGNKDA